MSTKLLKSFKLQHRHSDMAAIGSSLTRESMGAILAACYVRAMLKAVPPHVRELADRAAAVAVRQLIAVVQSKAGVDKIEEASAHRLRPEIVYALSVAKTVGLTETDMMEYCLETEVVQVVVQMISERLQIGDDEAAVAFRNNILERRRSPRLFKQEPLPNCSGAVDVTRWLKMIKFCAKESPIKLSKAARHSGAVLGGVK